MRYLTATDYGRPSVVKASSSTRILSPRPKPGTFQLTACHNICGWHSPLGPCPMFATKLNIICQISQFFCNRRLLSCLRTSRDEYSVIPEMFSTVLSTSMLNDSFFYKQTSMFYSIFYLRTELHI